MKKLLCLLLAAVSVASLAACSKGADNDGTTAAPTKAESATVKNWPNNAFFKEIPSIGGDIISYKEGKNDQGYTYTFEVNDIDYNGLKNYISQLEATGFAPYSPSILNPVKTEDILPEVLPEGQHNAIWSGNKRGFYVAVSWYADEYYQVNNLPKSYNARLVFYSYNAFATVTK